MSVFVTRRTDEDEEELGILVVGFVYISKRKRKLLNSKWLKHFTKIICHCNIPKNQRPSSLYFQTFTPRVENIVFLLIICFVILPSKYFQMCTPRVENIVLGESRGRNVIPASPKPPPALVIQQYAHTVVIVQTSQELQMLSSITINCKVTKIGMNPGSQLPVLLNQCLKCQKSL